MNVSERADLLERVDSLVRQRAWQEVIDVLAQEDAAELSQEPDLLYFYALAKRYLGFPSESRELLTPIKNIQNRRGTDRLYRRSRNLLGIIALDLGELDEAERCFRDSQLAALQSKDANYAGVTTMHLGIIASIRCEWEDSIAYYQRCLALWNMEDQLFYYALTHHNLAMALRGIDQLQEAHRCFTRALEIYQLGRDDEEIASAEFERALVQLMWGEYELAELCVRRALDRSRRRRFISVEAEALRVLGLVQIRIDKLSEAEETLRIALKIGKQIGSKMLIAEINEAYATIASRRGDSRKESKRKRIAAEYYLQMGAAKRATIALAEGNMSMFTTDNQRVRLRATS